jgi:hypothetical protein
LSCGKLKDWVRKLWTIRMDDSEYLKKLVQSMPWRLQGVIDREDATTQC